MIWNLKDWKREKEGRVGENGVLKRQEAKKQWQRDLKSVDVVKKINPELENNINSNAT